MRHTLIAGLVIALLAPVALTACGGGGSRSETEVSNTTVSKGQQLIDLKAARDGGAISQSEYERERQRVLDQ